MPDLKGVGNASPSIVLRHHIDPWEERGLGPAPIDLLCHRQTSSRNVPRQQQHAAGRKEKIPQMGKRKGYIIGDTKAAICPVA